MSGIADPPPATEIKKDPAWPREVKWFMGWLVVPMLMVVGLTMAFSRSPLPLWRQIFTWEDTCPYGICFVLPTVLYCFSLCIRALVSGLCRSRKERARQGLRGETNSGKRR